MSNILFCPFTVVGNGPDAGTVAVIHVDTHAVLDKACSLERIAVAIQRVSDAQQAVRDTVWKIHREIRLRRRAAWQKIQSNTGGGVAQEQFFRYLYRKWVDSRLRTLTAEHNKVNHEISTSYESQRNVLAQCATMSRHTVAFPDLILQAMHVAAQTKSYLPYFDTNALDPALPVYKALCYQIYTKLLTSGKYDAEFANWIDDCYAIHDQYDTLSTEQCIQDRQDLISYGVKIRSDIKRALFCQSQLLQAQIAFYDDKQSNVDPPQLSMEEVVALVAACDWESFDVNTGLIEDNEAYISSMLQIQLGIEEERLAHQMQRLCQCLEAISPELDHREKQEIL